MYRTIILIISLASSLLVNTSRADDNISAKFLTKPVRGLNVDGWLTFPQTRDSQTLEQYLDSPELVALYKAGFSFVRIAVNVDLVIKDDGAVDHQMAHEILEVSKIVEKCGLAVILVPFARRIDLTTLAGQEMLKKFWLIVAPTLTELPIDRTALEIVNEPNLPADEWIKLEKAAVHEIRQLLPDVTIVTSGADWGSINGLVARVPMEDSNIVYSIHYYEPSVITGDGGWDVSLNHSALAQLPFPASDRSDCKKVVASISDLKTRDLASYYCNQLWDSSRVESQIEQVVDWSHAFNAPVALLEFGILDEHRSEARLNYLKAVRVSAEKHGLAWALWSLEDHFGFSSKPPAINKGQLYNPELRLALGLNAP